MTTKTFCRFCEAYNTDDEAVWEHLMSCPGCRDGYRTCETYRNLGRLRDTAEQAMLTLCPGGDCGARQ